MKDKSKARYDRSEITKSLNKDGKFKFDAAPSIEFLRTLYDTGYTIPEAVNDLIDNCLDADATQIRVHLGQKDNLPYLTLADNGHGMDEQILCGSVVLGAGQVELLHRQKGFNGDGKNGCFGNGMNTSIATFQGRAVIMSKVTNGKLHKIIFDIEEMIENKSWEMMTENVTSDDEKFFNETIHNSDCGTIISIININQFKITAITPKISTLKKTIGETFRRSIWNTKEFYINDKLVESVDPMSYTKPVDGKDTKSKIFSTQEFDDVKYIDDEGNERTDGWMKLTFYELPDVGKGRAMVYGWGQTNSLFYILRNHRQIMAHQTFDILYRVSLAAKLRIEWEFSTELDRPMGINFTKTRVHPSDYIIDKVLGVCKSEFNRFRNVNYKKQGPTKKTKSTQKFTDRFLDYSRIIKPLLPTLPDLTPKLEPTKKPESTGRKNKSYNTQNNLIFDEANWGEYAKPFETNLHINGSKKIRITLNVDHPLYTQYLNKDIDDSDLEIVRSIILSLIASLGYAKWTNMLASDNLAEVKRFESKLRMMEESLGQILHTYLTSGIPVS